LLVLVLDQLSKALVASSLKMGDTIPVLGNFFRLTCILNPGGVFGTKLGSNFFYSLVSVLAIFVAGYIYFKSRSQGRILYIAFSLVLGGAVGNLIDRIRYGEVLDFLDFDFFNIHIPPLKSGFIDFSGFYLDRWPVFNIADSAVTIGMILILWYVIMPRKSSISTPWR
jgi:signal peptidase II